MWIDRSARSKKPTSYRNATSSTLNDRKPSSDFDSTNSSVAAFCLRLYNCESELLLFCYVKTCFCIHFRKLLSAIVSCITAAAVWGWTVKNIFAFAVLWVDAVSRRTENLKLWFWLFLLITVKKLQFIHVDDNKSSKREITHHYITECQSAVLEYIDLFNAFINPTISL